MTTKAVDVSVLVPVLDEARAIRAAADAMLAQQFDGDLELLFLDGGSSDGTREILEEVAAGDPRVRVLDNPDRLIPHALNRGLRAARGRYVARMDAHTVYPAGYLAAGVERLERGGADWVSGPALPLGVDRGSRRVALALRSRLGVGGAAFRVESTREFDTDTGFTGVWPRTTLERFGGWDEGWPVNEDAELAARVREGGGRIVCVPAMAARYVPRGTVRALGRQYWRYGQYRAKTARRHPTSMRRSHLLPPALVVALLGALLPGVFGRAPRAAVALYVVVLAAESGRLAARERSAGDALWLPVVFATMHGAWGAGFIAGSARFGPPLAALRRARRASAR